jgi:uncharacterized OB-fold protein
MDDSNWPIFEVDQHIVAHGRYYAGKIGSRFFTALRDEKKILGIRCPHCGVVLWPPRATCRDCFSQLGLEDMEEIGPQGILESFTIVTYKEPIHPRTPPFIVGIVRLNGASCGMTHFIDEVAHDEVKIGMRVTAVFAEHRQGHIMDISHFKPVRFSTD